MQTRSKFCAVLLATLLIVLTACGERGTPVPREERLRGCAVDEGHALLAFATGSGPDMVTRLYASSLGPEGWTDFRRVALPATGRGPTAFGEAMAISGDVAVIGASYEGEDKRRGHGPFGAAYVYERNGDTWAEGQRLAAPARAFGQTVAVCGDWLAVGGEGEGESTFLYHRKGDAWVFHQEFYTEKYGGGWSVALSERRLLVGARVFLRDGETWSEEASLPGPWAQARPLALTDECAVLQGKRAIEDEMKDWVFVRRGTNWGLDTSIIDNPCFGGGGTQAGDFFNFRGRTYLWEEGRWMLQPDAVSLWRSGRVAALSTDHAIVEKRGERFRAESLHIFERVKGPQVWRKQGEPFLPPVLQDGP